MCVVCLWWESPNISARLKGFCQSRRRSSRSRMQHLSGQLQLTARRPDRTRKQTGLSSRLASIRQLLCLNIGLVSVAVIAFTIQHLAYPFTEWSLGHLSMTSQPNFVTFLDPLQSSVSRRSGGVTSLILHAHLFLGLPCLHPSPPPSRPLCLVELSSLGWSFLRHGHTILASLSLYTVSRSMWFQKPFGFFHPHFVVCYVFFAWESEKPSVAFHLHCAYLPLGSAAYV